MNETEIQSLATQWIEVQKKADPRLKEKRKKIADYDPDFDVIQRVFDIQDDDWRAAFSIAVEVASQTNDPWILEILGAGLLEDLLEGRGEEILPLYLAAAKANPAFRQALRHVWESNTPETWKKFVRLREKLEL
jgi:hypothetical protein